jgi:DNA ligase (NAD+)
VKVITSERSGREKAFTMPDTCPVCGSKVERPEGEAVHRCTGIACPAQLKQNLSHFASRGAMDIEGIGHKFLEQMVDKAMIQDPADLYFLKKEDLMNMDRMGEKLAENMLKAIDKSRSPSLPSLIYALGIRNVGRHLAGVLATHFKSLDNLAARSAEDLEQVHEIGPIVAESIYNFMHNPKNIQVIKKLKAGGVNFPTEEGETKGGVLEDKVFVLTGGLDSFTRDEARKAIEDLGGRVSSSVSGKTDFLLVGRDPGSKVDQARRLEIDILDEEGFKEMIGRGKAD